VFIFTFSGASTGFNGNQATGGIGGNGGTGDNTTVTGNQAITFPNIDGTLST